MHVHMPACTHAPGHPAPDAARMLGTMYGHCMWAGHAAARTIAPAEVLPGVKEFKQCCRCFFAEDSARGTGWTFSPPTADGMLAAVDSALHVRWHQPEAWQVKPHRFWHVGCPAAPTPRANMSPRALPCRTPNQVPSLNLRSAGNHSRCWEGTERMTVCLIRRLCAMA